MNPQRTLMNAASVLANCLFREEAAADEPGLMNVSRMKNTFYQYMVEWLPTDTYPSGSVDEKCDWSYMAALDALAKFCNETAPADETTLANRIITVWHSFLHWQPQIEKAWTDPLVETTTTPQASAVANEVPNVMDAAFDAVANATADRLGFDVRRLAGN